MKFTNMLWMFLSLLSVGAVAFASPTYDDRTTTEEVSHEEGRHKDHHRSQERKIRDLREKLDTAIIRQEIQEIELNNFKKSLKSTERLLAQLVDERHEERKKKKELLNHQDKPEENYTLRPESPPGTTTEKVNQLTFEAQVELREEFLRLKAEMEVLKSTCLKTSSDSNIRRDETKLTWLLQIVPLLQQNLGDLQESANVLGELHNKKETDIKIASLVDELAEMAQSLAKMTAKVEATEAVAQMLNQEFAQSSSQMHQTEMKMAVIKEKLDEDTEILDSLLRALPDGFLESKHTRMSTKLQETKSLKQISDDIDVIGKMEKLELKTATLDFALLNLQKKVFMQSTENRQTSPELMVHSTSVQKGQGADSIGSHYENRLSSVEDELSKIKKSSSSLVKMLSEVEKFEDGIKDQLTENMAELETKMEHEHDDRITSENDSKVSRQELEQEEHTDIFEFKRILGSLGERLKKLEKKDSKSSNDDRSEKCFNILQDRLNMTDGRVSKLEDLTKIALENRTRRHHRKPHHHRDEVL